VQQEVVLTKPIDSQANDSHDEVIVVGSEVWSGGSQTFHVGRSEFNAN